MRHGYYIWAIVVVLAKIKADSTEDQHPYTYSFYAPSSMNFNDIYLHNTNMPTTAEEEEKPVQPTTTTEDTFNLNKIPTQFVEFYPELTTIPPTIPPPKYILNSTFLRETTIRRRTTTTEEPEDDIIKVIPIKRDYQRGVLDLLFPTNRVKSFKNVFDSIRRLLSHTFRR